MRKWKTGDRVKQHTRHGTVESVSQYSGRVFVQWDGGAPGTYETPTSLERLDESPVVSCGWPSADDSDTDVTTIYDIPVCP